MSIRLFVAAAAVIAVPMAVMGQPSTTTKRKEQASERRFCVVDNDPSNRLRRISRCYTRAEYDAMRLESRRAIDRIQSARPSY